MGEGIEQKGYTEYNEKSRKELVNDYKKKWAKKLLLQSDEAKKMVNDFESLRGDGTCTTMLPNELRQKLRKTEKKPSEVMVDKKYKDLITYFVPEKLQDEYLYMIDKLIQFPYSQGMSRRTIRSTDYTLFVYRILQLLHDYRVLDFYGGNLAAYLRNELPEELLDHKAFSYDFCMNYEDNVIAAAIDCGDADVIAAVIELLNSDNNTANITVDVIRGIVKSSNTKLHQLLADFLLAAKLQEGVRQVVCENADCGTIEAFKTIFDTVYENNLIRFSAVKRAIITWTGVFDFEHIDRITAKVTETIKLALYDQNIAYQYARSYDNIQIVIGLWSLGFHDVSLPIEVMHKYIEEMHSMQTGTKNQLLSMAYYNRELGLKQFVSAISKKVMENMADNPILEVIAAFMPTYLENDDWYCSWVREHCGKPNYYSFNINGAGEDNIKIPIDYFFMDEEEALKHFKILKKIYEYMPKNKMNFPASTFSWYSLELTKSELVKKICMIAYLLQDEKVTDYAIELLERIDGGYGYDSRAGYVRLLLREPQNEYQMKKLLEFVANKESQTREQAFQIVKTKELIPSHYEILENFLRLKNEDIRRNVIQLLMRQEGEELKACVKRLLESKMQTIREGGLNLILEKKDNQALKDLASQIEVSTEKELILWERIVKGDVADTILETEGYGLYRKNATWDITVKKADRKIVESYFDIAPKEINEIIEKLANFIEANANCEYTDADGEERLLGNGLYSISYEPNISFEERYPFKELWIQFYEKEINDPHKLNLLWLASLGDGTKLKNKMDKEKFEEMFLGKAVSHYAVPEFPFLKGNWQGERMIDDILYILKCVYKEEGKREVGRELLLWMMEVVSEEEMWYERDMSSYYGGKFFSLLDSPKMKAVINPFSYWQNEEEFGEMFQICYLLDQKYRFNDWKLKKEYDYHQDNKNFLCIFDYLKAYTTIEEKHSNKISEELFFKAVFEDLGLAHSLEHLSLLVEENLYPNKMNMLTAYMPQEDLKDRKVNPENPFAKAGIAFYTKLVDKILDVELKRGEMPTVFSSSIVKISKIYGADRLVEILKALGTDKLDRGTYYYWSANQTGKNECLSYLLRVCTPAPEDNAQVLRAMLKDTKISKQRLIETAMYAPQWLPILEEYLGYPGFQSGCCYFMAHMNEIFDDKKKALIARYTPLSSEELSRGAFDIKWFEEVFALLGEDKFGELYNAAKYISDGNKHARARKYADAALGRVTTEALEKEILQKRNKDLLMSYSLLPISEKHSLVRRYEFLQRFLKESKKFGSQRQASESLAVTMALKNLASKAGFDDVMRLTLVMETEIVKQHDDYFKWHTVDDVSVKLEIDECGKSLILCEKNGKKVKSIPSRLKKEEWIVSIKEINKTLKEQYSRTVRMFEQAMEEGETYCYGELLALCENPVADSIVKSLVYIHSPEVHGYLMEDGLVDCFGKKYNLMKELSIEETILRVAHPVELFQAGCLTEYQNGFFANISEKIVKKQPFKQIFREFYMKLPEEGEKKSSRMFAGYQIQPTKTAACLKGRKWIADMEEGLQKVYYRDNIIARIYALADWFSPSDVEAPTLEWVEFSNRKTFENIAINEVPDVIYSEIMRDVDLAVSVAHVGGVDPETSHSTVEMRKVILGFHLPLFGIKNVTLEGNHALIEGTIGDYSVHLGSGVIHQKGGPQIPVLPVHSQSRGKLFLPFVDEDPKTAEIMSKVILFAQDKKIKDTNILSRIVRK